jgi:hypothetical protein
MLMSKKTFNGIIFTVIGMNVMMYLFVFGKFIDNYMEYNYFIPNQFSWLLPTQKSSWQVMWEITIISLHFIIPIGLITSIPIILITELVLKMRECYTTRTRNIEAPDNSNLGDADNSS